MTLTRNIWRAPKEFWGFPNIPDPIVVESPDDFKKDDIHAMLSSELEFLTLHDKQIYVSLPTIEQRLKPVDDEERTRFAEWLVYHGAGHYALIPFDLRTEVALTYRANQALTDMRSEGQETMANASIIVNIFEDIIDNTYLLENGIDDGIELYRRVLGNKPQGLLQRISSLFSPQNQVGMNVYMRTLERLWKKDGAIVGRIGGAEEMAAKHAAEVFSTNLYDSSQWEDQVYEFTRILAPFMKARSGQNKNMQPFEKGGSGQMNKIKREMSKKGRKELEKEVERSLKKASAREKDSEKTRRKYQEFVKGNGLGDEKKANVWFYRNMAARHAVNFNPVESQSSSDSTPFNPSKWTPGDPIEDLDITYSAMMGGRVIPSVSTYRWDNSEQPDGFKAGKTIPDLHIILDTSWSMADPTNSIAPAVIGSFAASESALSKGAGVGVCVFAGNGNKIIVPETKDRDQVGEALVTYLGGGTNLPTTALSRMVRRKHHPKHILLVSDAGIWNFDEAFPYLKDLVATNPENTGSVFLIGNYRSDVVEKLEAAEFEVFPIPNQYELINPILGKMHQVYGGGSA